MEAPGMVRIMRAQTTIAGKKDRRLPVVNSVLRQGTGSRRRERPNIFKGFIPGAIFV
jgi:hypothetical protein